MNSSPENPPSLIEELRGWEIVAFLGLLTFVCTIAFEFGVASHWEFPTELISFSFENAVRVFLPMAFASLLILFIFPEPRDEAYSKRVRVTLWVLVGVAFLLIAACVWYAIDRVANFIHSDLSMLSAISIGAGFYFFVGLIKPKAVSRLLPRPLQFYLSLLCILPWCFLATGHYSTITTRFAAIEESAREKEPTRIWLALRTYGTTWVCAEPAENGFLKEGFRVFDITALPDGATVKTKNKKVFPFRRTMLPPHITDRVSAPK